jgi:hypothetical protein
MHRRFILASLVAGLAAIGVIGATVSLVRLAGFDDYYQEEGLFALACGVVGLLLLSRAATQNVTTPTAVVGALLLATSFWRFLRFVMVLLEDVIAGDNTVVLVATRVLLSLIVLGISVRVANRQGSRPV